MLKVCAGFGTRSPESFTFKGHTENVLAVSTDGQTIVSGSEDETVR